MGFHQSTSSKPNTEFNLYLAPYGVWAFPTMKRELWGRKFQSDQRSAALLAKGGTLKKRLSLHFHKVLTRSNKVSPQTLQTALIYLSVPLSCVNLYFCIIHLLKLIHPFLCIQHCTWNQV
jgi:hypothetical protein